MTVDGTMLLWLYKACFKHVSFGEYFCLLGWCEGKPKRNPPTCLDDLLLASVEDQGPLV